MRLFYGAPWTYSLATAGAVAILSAVALSGCSSVLGIEDLQVGDGDNADAGIDPDAPAINITSPNGGEVFPLESNQTITWSSRNTSGVVDIILMRDGSMEEVVAEDVTDNGTFNWTIPITIPNSGVYRIRVVDNADTTVFDESDQLFGIASWRFFTEIEVNNRSNNDRPGFAVAIKLTPANFDYDHAKPDGSDLRFASSTQQADGFDLPHFIEEWNPGGESYVWVAGNFIGGSTGSLFMFYGNEIANDASNIDMVFPNRFISTGDQTINATLEVDRFEILQGHTVTIVPPAPPAPPAGILIIAKSIVINGTLDGTGGGHPGGAPRSNGLGPGGAIVGSSSVGGAGGGFGGRGGAGGFDDGETRSGGGGSYGSATNLSGQPGSGGSGANDGTIPGTPLGSGGAGGAGFTLNGTSRIIVGSQARIISNGAPGESINGNSGGGGSGGHVILLGTHIDMDGSLEARGGDGGRGVGGPNDDGGGGGGGRIVVAFDETSNVPANVGTVTGGVGGPLGGVSGGLAGSTGSAQLSQISINIEVTVQNETIVFP